MDIEGLFSARHPCKKVQYADSTLWHLLTPYIFSENRNGLVVDVEGAKASGYAERDAAENLARRRLKLLSLCGRKCYAPLII